MLVIYVGAVDPITWVKAGHSAPSITLRSSSRGTTGTPLVLPVCDRLKPLEAYWHGSAVKIGEVVGGSSQSTAGKPVGSG